MSRKHTPQTMKHGFQPPCGGRVYRNRAKAVKHSQRCKACQAIAGPPRDSEIEILMSLNQAIR